MFETKHHVVAGSADTLKIILHQNLGDTWYEVRGPYLKLPSISFKA